jgi:hypothetical protein
MPIKKSRFVIRPSAGKAFRFNAALRYDCSALGRFWSLIVRPLAAGVGAETAAAIPRRDDMANWGIFKCHKWGELIRR